MAVEAPYNFVPIPPSADAICETPVFHDRSGCAAPAGQAAGDALLSGELRCELEALTPLFAGNWSYDYPELGDNVQQQAFSAQSCLSAVPQADRGPQGKLREKKILEPLRAPGEGRPVLIAGSALKGMLRHSFSILTGAPMERVAEQQYSYRPNLQIDNIPTGERQYWRHAAVVVGTTAAGDLQVNLVEQLSDLMFVSWGACQPGFVPLAGVTWQPGAGVERAAVPVTFRNGVKKVLLNPPAQLLGYTNNQNLSHTVHPYTGSLDGEFELAEAHNQALRAAQKDPRLPLALGQSGHYPFVLVRRGSLYRDPGVARPKVFNIREGQVLSQYENARDHLENLENGHLRGSYPASRATLTAARNGARAHRGDLYRAGQLIFTEVEYVAGPNGTRVPFRIVSCGTNFRYRWLYEDSVRRKRGIERRELRAAEAEKQLASDGRPTKLTGARLLFGYCVDETPGVGNAGVGSGDFTRLAGRVSVNAAVEQIVGAGEDNNRFLRPQQGYLVPLKPLGTPRPSAVEHYLRQTNVSAARNQRPGCVVTYGDLPGHDAGGDLRGRKVYLHQPDARQDRNAYEASNADEMVTNQAVWLRFVSKPETRFRFTLRFRNLRSWELGALLLALEPERIRRAELPDVLTESVGSYRDLIAQDYGTNSRVFALKLGHARPLGLGSVAVAVRQCRLVGTDGALVDDAAAIDDAVNRWLEKLTNGSNLRAWLEAMRYAGRHRYSYPTRPNQNGEQEIFGHHTRIRRDHSTVRRRTGEPAAHADVLVSLE